MLHFSWYLSSLFQMCFRLFTAAQNVYFVLFEDCYKIIRGVDVRDLKTLQKNKNLKIKFFNKNFSLGKKQ